MARKKQKTEWVQVRLVKRVWSRLERLRDTLEVKVMEEAPDDRGFVKFSLSDAIAHLLEVARSSAYRGGKNTGWYPEEIVGPGPAADEDDVPQVRADGFPDKP